MCFKIPFTVLNEFARGYIIFLTKWTHFCLESRACLCGWRQLSFFHMVFPSTTYSIIPSPSFCNGEFTGALGELGFLSL